MALSVTVTGAEDVKRALASLERKVQRSVVRDAALVAAHDTAGQIIVSINSGPATGRMRADGKSRASARGEFPMADKGILTANISAERDGNGANVVSRASYAHKLEYADPKSGGRPYMRRGLDDNKVRIAALFNWALRRLLMRPTI